MESTEKIPVYVKIIKGKTVCICHAGRKKCKGNCTREIVGRDKFTGWQGTMYRNRFGK